MSDSVIVIPTHYSGLHWLDSLLESFKGFDGYPILIVANEYCSAQQEKYSELLKKHNSLPVEFLSLRTNSFEFGALYTAYQRTTYNDFFILPHSCEIVNVDLFPLIFEKHRYRSVAFSIDSPPFWHGHIGKFRRMVLDLMNLKKYLPSHLFEAVVKTEVYFTIDYHQAAPSAVILFPEWNNTGIFEEKFGEKRMRIANEYIVKWKSIWSLTMLHEKSRKDGRLPYYMSLLRSRWFCMRNKKNWLRAV